MLKLPAALLRSSSQFRCSVRLVASSSPSTAAGTEGQQVAATEGRSAEDSLKYHDYFGVNGLFTVRDLFNARVHLGHRDTSLDKRMTGFVFGNRCVHCTVYTVRCTPYTVHCTFYNVHSVHCSLYAVHCTLFVVRRSL